MKKTELNKQDSTTTALNEELQKKQALLKRLDNARQNVVKLNANLDQAKLTLTSDLNDACHPIQVCLKSIDALGGRTIPLGCKPSALAAILQKSSLTQSDLDIIQDTIKQADILNTFNISQHPDYSKYVQTQNVSSCLPNDRQTLVSDYPLTAFPTYNNYISADKLLAPRTSSNASLGLVNGSSANQSVLSSSAGTSQVSNIPFSNILQPSAILSTPNPTNFTGVADLQSSTYTASSAGAKQSAVKQVCISNVSRYIIYGKSLCRRRCSFLRFRASVSPSLCRTHLPMFMHLLPRSTIINLSSIPRFNHRLPLVRKK